MNAAEKLETIISRINLLPDGDKFIKDAKINRTYFYSENIDRLNQLSVDKILNHSFAGEVAALADKYRRLAWFNGKALKNISGLEVHRFAPELNKLHFKSGLFIKVAGIDSIEAAIEFIVNSMSIEQIKSIK